jgi:hypothetical protein
MQGKPSKTRHKIRQDNQDKDKHKRSSMQEVKKKRKKKKRMVIVFRPIEE